MPMTRGAALAHLIRMRDMKVRRLEHYDGNTRSKDFLKADIGALNVAIITVEHSLREVAKSNVES